MNPLRSNLSLRTRHTLMCVAITAAFPIHTALAQDTAPSPESTGPHSQQAQAQGSQRLDVVIVTAQRRAENIKDVPMSITTVSGDKLDT